LLVGRRSTSKTPPSPRLTAVLLTGPFVLSWIAVAAGLYPYGRTRQCIFLAVFALAGVSVALAQIARNRIGLAVSLAFVMVGICQAFGTLQGRDMLPLSELRHEHMDQAIQFIRSEISPDDVLFTDRATSFQLRHYLCRQKSVLVEPSKDGLESFRCEGLHVLLTGPNDGALTAESVAARAQSVGPADRVWLVQAGWASGLGEALRSQFPAFSRIEIHSFGRYIEVFQLPSQKPQPAQFLRQR